MVVGPIGSFLELFLPSDFRGDGHAHIQLFYVSEPKGYNTKILTDKVELGGV